jgi:hypothetical protein
MCNKLSREPKGVMYASMPGGLYSTLNRVMRIIVDLSPVEDALQRIPVRFRDAFVVKETAGFVYLLDLPVSALYLRQVISVIVIAPSLVSLA